MSKLNYLRNKILKIVMGVSVFLCAALVFSSEVLAIDVTVGAENYNYFSGDSYISFVIHGGETSCIGKNGSNILRFKCANGNYIYDNGKGELSGITDYCNDGDPNQYEYGRSTINLTANKSKLSYGVNECKLQVYNTKEYSVGNIVWHTLGKTPVKYDYLMKTKVSISHVGLPDNNVTYKDQQWKSGGFDAVYTYNGGTSFKLPEIEYKGYILKGFSEKSCGSDLQKAGTSVTLKATFTREYMKYYACWEKDSSSTSSTTSFDIALYANGDGATLRNNSTKWGSVCSSKCNFNLYFPNNSTEGTKREGYKVKGVSTSSSCSNVVSISEARFTKEKPTWYVCWEKVSSSTTDTINAERYVTYGASADGKSLDCGSKVYVTTCDKTYCNYSKVNGKSSSGKVYRNKLTVELASADCGKKCNSNQIEFNGHCVDYKSSSLTTKTETSINAIERYVFCSFSNKPSGTGDNQVWESGGATLSKNYDHCAFKSTSAGTWTVYGIDDDGNGYKKTIKVTEASRTNQFKVVFEGNGGKTSSGERQLTFSCNGSCTSFPGVAGFVKSGYTFLGWSSKTDCSNPGNVRNVTGATTYYACWSKSGSNGASSSSKQYTVTFSQSWGKGLTCESSYNKPQDGLCSKYQNAGTTITLPKGDSVNAYNDYKFMGWTSSPLNGDKTVCTASTIKKPGEKYTVNSNVLFYACYREDVNAVRYARDNASADGTKIPCGSALHITECVVEPNEIEYCYYDKIGNTSAKGKVYRAYLAQKETISQCKDTGYKEEEDENLTTINAYRYGTISSIIDVEFECGAKLFITTCDDNICNFTSVTNPGGKTQNISGTVNLEYLHTSQAKALKDTDHCPKIEIEEEEPEEEGEEAKEVLTQTSCSNSPLKNVKGSATLKMCYNSSYDDQEVKEMIKESNLVLCGNGYTYDETSTRANGDVLCNDKICVRNYTVTCNKNVTVGNVALNTTPATVGSNGYGIVKVQAGSSNGKIVGYYLSEIYSAPTTQSDWVTVSSDSFTIESTPGVQYIWVKDSNGTVSSVATITVLDTVNTDTTLKMLQLKDGNNNDIVPGSISHAASVGNGYQLLSNTKNQKDLIASGFNSFTHEYRLDVDSPTLAVYATLTSTDSSYVDGYGPRTVNLKYGVNTILIKIRNKEGKIRTYTIIANRTDDRTSDNTLSDITVSVGDIKFNANVTEYKITIPSKTTEVDVSSMLGSHLSNYVEGYAPGKVLITGDTTVKLIKVKSETGSTRTYVLTFVKEKTDIITKTSLQLSGLTIPGVYIPFESSVANYNISVDYSIDVIDIYAALKDSNSYVITSISNKGDSSYKEVSNEGINLEVGENFVEIRVVDSNSNEAYYRLTIIRKEYGLDISNDTSLKDLKVLGYNIKFDPNDKEYTVKIKSEKSLVITAVPTSNRAEVFIRGNDELTGFSTVRIKVVAENGEFETYSIDIKKDAFNKTIEIAAIIVGCVIILGSSYIIIMKRKNKNRKDYYRD